MCPCIWLTGISGFLDPSERPLAYCNPTKSAPTRPGPYVTPIASTSSNVKFASFNAAFTTPSTASICILDATSGTTPPNFLWVSIWDAMTLERTFLPSTTIAAAVSSQLDSIPKIIFFSINLYLFY